jgi:hypothetical protein
MKIFLHDERGNYTRQLDAREDPLEPGRYLMPRNSTRVAPSAEIQRRAKYGRWTGKEWIGSARRLKVKKKEKKK